jgi:hypothetical protein
VTYVLLILLTHLNPGEQLETVHIERERAQAAYDIVDFYNQMAKNDVTRLDGIRKEGKPGRRQVAVLLRRLSIVAKEVDLPASDQVFLLRMRDELSMTSYRREKTSKDTAKSLRRKCSICLTDRTGKATRR